MGRFSRVHYTMETQKCEKKFKKFEIGEIDFCPYIKFPYAEKKNRLSFVNISPTLVICQRKGLHEYYNMGTKKFDFFSKKFEIEFDLYFDLC